MWRVLADRTAVLLIGVGVGAAIGLAFAGGGVATAVGPKNVMIVGTPVEPPAKPKPGVAPEVAAVQACKSSFQGHLAQAIAGNEPIKVGVFGDSFGDGVWSGLMRQLRRKDGFDVVKLSQQSTGFTRYRSLNLETRLTEQMRSDPIDIAVISFGANDTQSIVTSKGKYAPYMSPAWQAEISERIERYVGVLRSHQVQLYWVGLPRMRKPEFDSDIAAMNSFVATEMQRLNVPFIDTRPYASDGQGNYSDYLNDEQGVRTLVRAGDGVHMSMSGYVWITRDLAKRIRSYVDAVRTVIGNEGAKDEEATPA